MPYTFPSSPTQNQTHTVNGKTYTYDGKGWMPAASGSGSLDTEGVQDTVAAMVVQGAGITKTYDDTAGTLTLASTVTPGSTGVVRTPETYNANAGDGTTDCQTAITSAIAALQSGDTLYFAPGKIYPHSGVITFNKAGTKILGYNATVRATTPTASAFKIDSTSDVQMEGLTLDISNPGARGSSWDEQKLNIISSSDVRLKNVRVHSSKAAGIYAWGSTKLVYDQCLVRNTLADGFHLTGGAQDVQVIDCVSSHIGDDGFAVVDYNQDTTLFCKRIKFLNCKVYHQTANARGITIAGGEDIQVDSCEVTGSTGAGLMIAAEWGTDFKTKQVTNVRVKGLRLIDCNRSYATLDHGAILIFSQRPNENITDVDISEVEILNAPAGSNPIKFKRDGSTGNVASISISRVRVYGRRSGTIISYDSGMTAATTTNISGDTEFQWRA